jgi:hypothetical protein
MKSIRIAQRIGMWLVLTLSGAAVAADLVVISNSGVKLAVADVRDVFLGEKQFADSVKLVPVDNSALQADFLAKAVKMEAGRYSTAWTKKAFRDGIAAPAVKSGDAEVIEFVKRTPGAVGYVSSNPGGANIVGAFH